VEKFFIKKKKLRTFLLNSFSGKGSGPMNLSNKFVNIKQTTFGSPAFEIFVKVIFSGEK